MVDIRLRIPGPRSVVGAAFRVVEWELEVMRLAASLPARVVALFEDVNEIMGRVRGLLDDASRTVMAIDGIVLSAVETVDGVRTTVERADRVVGDVSRTVSKADGVVARVGSTVDAADGVVARVGSTVDAADGLVSTAGGLVGRAEPLLGFAESAVAPIRPVVEALLLDADLDPELARLVAGRIVEVLVYIDGALATLEPIVDQVLGSIDPQEIKAVVDLIDHLPALATTLEKDVMPVLASLDNVGPEVNQILDVAQQCLEALAGIPGFQFLRRRGENGKE